MDPMNVTGTDSRLGFRTLTLDETFCTVGGVVQDKQEVIVNGKAGDTPLLVFIPDIESA